MNFVWFFSKKIAFAKSNKNLSKLIIRIGQIAVTLGILVSIITISVGFGAKKAIKQKMSDFNGHITVKPYSTNNSFNSSPLQLDSIPVNALKEVKEIVHIQQFAELSGVIRTAENFEGVICKGLSADYDKDRFSEFLVEGKLPDFQPNEYSNEVILSEKMAKKLHLKVDSTFVMYFIREGKEPLYRRFTIAALFSTEIKDIDDAYMICDIKQIQKLQNWDAKTIGGLELFVDDIEDLDDVYTSLNPLKNFSTSFQKSTDKFASINDWIELFDTNIYIIISLMMIVVIINMMMVLVILIIERTQSIGILKTLGANNATIRNIFIQYTLFIMLPGLVVGNILAISFILIQKYGKVIKLDPENYFISSVPVYFDFWFIFIINVVALIISGLMLIIPSYFIAKVSPVKAITFD